MKSNKPLTEKESLDLITSMIQNAKASYHETGTNAILWGCVIAIASLLTYLSIELNFKLSFSPFLLTIIAIAFQIYISIKAAKESKVTKFEDAAINAVWLAFGISIIGLVLYLNIIPNSSIKLATQEGWQFTKHYLDANKPDEPLTPFAPSSYSLFILLYALPTFTTGIVKNYKPMIVGAILTYVLFIISCYTSTKYDMLAGTIAAISCWLIPGLILRRNYLQQKNSNV